MLEQKFIATTNYVVLVESNFATYSNEFALLLQAVGAELYNFFFKVYGDFVTPELIDMTRQHRILDTTL